jgi:hypothetical protein
MVAPLPALIVLVLGVSVASGEEKNATKTTAPKEVTLEGEILDLYCFMKHPEDGQGADHIKCATSCIGKGLPIGFLSGGTVYVILGGKDHASAKDLVAGYVGVQSRLTGLLIEHDGVKSIEVASIAPVKKAADK